jgi:glycosyltransferase involved in cell wall biosynthesis
MPVPSQDPEISLIINTYMKPRHLGLVLDSIEHQEGVAGRFEVVVSDDGSTDATASLVHARAATAPYRLAFTTRPHDGFRLSRVRNDGARIACGKRLLFLDGDCMLPRDHVAVHLDRCREGVATGGDCGRLNESQSRGISGTSLNAKAVASLLPASERKALRARLRKWRWYALLRHPTKPRLVGNNICIHRRDFERVNGFDERFVGWGQEDDDITLRLRAAGVRLATVLDRTCSLHVWHPTDPTATTRWRDGSNVGYFLRRGRLTCCREGLSQRSVQELRWRLPQDLAQTAIGRTLAEILTPASAFKAAHQAAPRNPGDPTAEIDLVIRPGIGKFQPQKRRGPRRTPECRVLLLEGDIDVPASLLRKADVVLRVPRQLAAAAEADSSGSLSPNESSIAMMRELRKLLEQIG